MNVSQKTQLPNTPLPAGAIWAAEVFTEPEYGEPDPNGERFVQGPRYEVGDATVVACCFQRADGTIRLDGDSAPSVLIGEQGAELTAAHAREFTERILDAARLVETWTITWNRDLKRNAGIAHPCRIARTATNS